MIQALLGRKLGMTRLFDANGVVTGATLVEAGPCFITLLRTPERDGYAAVQLGFGEQPRPNATATRQFSWALANGHARTGPRKVI